jgi:hypothetical protein
MKKNNITKYKVHVICWDNREYIRETTKEEIDKYRKEGYVKENDFSMITFDFSLL